MKCPFCGNIEYHLIKEFDAPQDDELIQYLKSKLEDWTVEKGICSRCLDKMQINHMLQSAVQLTEKKGITEVNGHPILPIPLRLMAHPGFTGDGVTICFIDSGFFLHPDLTQPINRIKKVLDITNPEREERFFEEPHNSSWHGTMTSVVCAGSGYASNGEYKGIACNADLVLLKVMKEEGGISGEDITKALQWVLENHEEYNIRIVNMSVTDDWPISYKESEIAHTIRKLVDKDITIVAAAGNNPDAELLPPANVPEAITVGGLNDRNTLNPFDNTLYHSTYGITVDQVHKPEVIAPAIWIPAPILPKTAAFLEADKLLSFLEMSADDRENNKEALLGLLDITNFDGSSEDLEQLIQQNLNNRKVISRYYQHADGTSFAAPITTSVIAQMLEANPNLKPSDIREILINTARPIKTDSAIRQGFGLIQPLAAVNSVADEHHQHLLPISPEIDYKNHSITFTYHTHDASRVVLTGDFKNWSSDGLPLNEVETGVWQLKVELPPKGIYRYKFLVDQHLWIVDPRNIYREPDGFNGFNSKFYIEEVESQKL